MDIKSPISLNSEFIRKLLSLASVMAVMRVGLSFLSVEKILGIPASWLGDIIVVGMVMALALALHKYLLWRLQPRDVDERASDILPVSVRILVGFLVWFVAALILLYFVFDYPLTTVVTVFSMVVLVISITLHKLFYDLFVGIAFSMNGEFATGDNISIRIEGKTYYGRIVSMGWRAVRVKLALEQSFLHFSNSELSQAAVMNYNALKTEARRLDVMVQLRSGVQLERAKRVLLGAAEKAAREKGMASQPAPEVLINELDGDGIRYQVIVSFHPDQISPDKGKSILSEYVYEVLERNFLTLPPHIMEMNKSTPAYERADIPDALDVISRVSIFSESLTLHQLSQLAGFADQRKVNASEIVVAQGDPGDRMYVVIDGGLAVKVKLPDGKEIEVAVFSAGDFFGELSLFTGAERTATVYALTKATLLEISKTDFQNLFASQPSLAARLTSRLSEALSERQAGMEASTKKYDELTLATRKEEIVHDMLEKISLFFDIRKPF